MNLKRFLNKQTHFVGSFADDFEVIMIPIKIMIVVDNMVTNIGLACGGQATFMFLDSGT